MEAPNYSAISTSITNKINKNNSLCQDKRHNHHYHNGHSSERLTSHHSKHLIVAIIITTLFMIVEATGGWLSGSLALIADAGHMLTDIAALLMALLAVRFSCRNPNSRYTFGYLRLTTLTAFLNALLLLLITIIITWEAIYRFFQPQHITGKTMVVVAIIGTITNLVLFWFLRNDSNERNVNIRAATLHVMGDLLGSVGSIIAALIILYTDWMFVDPLLSIFVSCLILQSVWRLLQSSLRELLEGTPKQCNIDAIIYNMKNTIPKICSIHHVHIWQIGEHSLMTMHVYVTSLDSDDTLLHDMHIYLLENHNISHATIQIEHKMCENLNCDIHRRLLSINRKS